MQSYCIFVSEMVPELKSYGMTWLFISAHVVASCFEVCWTLNNFDFKAKARSVDLAPLFNLSTMN